MKKQDRPSIKAQLLRGAFYLLLLSAGTVLAFLRPGVPAKNSQQPLTFKERVAYQRAIEEVYWRHRIWPKERPDRKPLFDAVMSQVQLEKKVADYLRTSQALEDYWQQPITAEQLQGEMERMAHRTKQPEVLRELFEALGNDPLVIAECLGRPVLAERTLATNASLKEQLQTRQSRAGKQTTKAVGAPGSSYMLPQGRSPFGFIFNYLNTGGRYNPNANSWTPTSTTNAPDRRAGHTAVWTGSEMIVWGGQDVNNLPLNTGGRYNPTTDSWTATSIVSAPDARGGHTAVWTGTEMIVWGGSPNGGFTFFNTGGRYNPSTDAWTATSTANAPTARESHTAVWTGSEMIVWGGYDGSNSLNTGGTYNPSGDSWTATSTTGAPVGRLNHTAVWTGGEMIVWGGFGFNGSYLNTGGRYNPGTDSWAATSTTNAPAGRAGHTAVWTASEMIVWGGAISIIFDTNTGGRYNPSTDSWTAANNGFKPRQSHTAVWTGSEMIVWGGVGIIGQYFDSGVRYNPGTDTWTATSYTNAPAARTHHTAVWTGSEMIVWGGRGEPTPTPTATPTATPRITPTPRPRPTPAPRPTP
jgi:N-acetylneuraminic acid mutarotase